MRNIRHIIFMWRWKYLSINCISVPLSNFVIWIIENWDHFENKKYSQKIIFN